MDIAVATLEKPPYNKLFDKNNTWFSPVLQCCLDSQASKSAPSAPIFDFTIGNEIAGLFHPLQPTVAQLPAVTDVNLSDHLLPSGHNIREDMGLADFCAIYQLSSNILTKFQDNAFKTAHLLHFVTIPQLEKMGFVTIALFFSPFTYIFTYFWNNQSVRPT